MQGRLEYGGLAFQFSGLNRPRSAKENRPMKSHILKCAATLCLVLGSLLANGQSDSHLAISVPFDFMVGHTMFPAGEYNLARVKRQTYVLAAKNGYEFAIINTRPVVMNAGFRMGGLAFVNYGHHYRLQQLSTRSLGREKLSQLPLE
jgi:hypothetical protein